MNFNIGSGPSKKENLKEWHKKVCTKKLFPEDYSPQLQKAIYTITTKKAPIVLFGTSIYKSLIYAGDVDIHQWVLTEDIPYHMQNTIRKIQDANEYLIGDIKCGLNEKYLPLDIALGEVKKGKIKNYKPDVFNKSGWEVPSKENITLESWVKIYNKLHELITLRWSPQDILNGYLMIDEDTKISLEYASKQTPLNKIDMYGFINGKYLEITNVFVPEVTVEPNLKLNLLIQYYSGNFAKAIKRAYAISRIFDKKNDSTNIKKLYPFLVSQTNLLSSCASDMDVIVVALTKGVSLNKIKNRVASSLNLIISKMGNYYETNIESIIEATKNLLLSIQNIDDKSFVNILEKIEKDIKIIVNEQAVKYIKTKKLNLIKTFGP